MLRVIWTLSIKPRFLLPWSIKAKDELFAIPSHMTAAKPERLDRLFSRLGYGSRKTVRFWIDKGLISVNGLPATSPAQRADPYHVLLDGKALDHPFGLAVIYHKPANSVCSHKEQGRLIYADMPEQWTHRKPPLSSIGRLDKDTSGLLILTDDGQLNHRLSSPKRHISKTYHVVLDRELRGEEAGAFASGKLLLDGETTPCLPAQMHQLVANEVELSICEGRYHQARRMFAAFGHHVVKLERTRIGKLTLADLPLQPGEYQCIDTDELLKRIGV